MLVEQSMHTSHTTACEIFGSHFLGTIDLNLGDKILHGLLQTQNLVVNLAYMWKERKKTPEEITPGGLSTEASRCMPGL